jgi:hypothetical protein
MVKKIRGGTAQQDNPKKSWLSTILNGIFYIFMFLLCVIILIAGISVVFMFIGSYIMLEYFLKMINYIVKGLNKMIKIFTKPLKKLGVKAKGKIDKVPTDPSQLVLKALGLPPLTEDDDTPEDEEDDCVDE